MGNSNKKARAKSDHYIIISGDFGSRYRLNFPINIVTRHAALNHIISKKRVETYVDLLAYTGFDSSKYHHIASCGYSASDLRYYDKTPLVYHLYPRSIRRMPQKHTKIR